jgi:ubiquitin carboxyl-terminal hydrolase 34
MYRGKQADNDIDVMDSVARLMVVDELEEDGSGMYYSDDSSVASSNTAG